jgi:tetratricopeptide (TPR) repeat protein
LCVPVSAAEEHSSAELLARAEAAFREGERQIDKLAESRNAFARSAALYAQLCQRGSRNPDLYRNMGNAFLLAGRLAPAILAYRQGLRLAPNDGVLQENLEYARASVHYPSGFGPPGTSWPGGLLRPPLLFLQGLTLIFWTLGCCLWTHRLISRRGTGVALLATIIAVLAGAGTVLTYWQACQDDHFPLVVIAADATPLYRGNGASHPRHPELPVVNAGMEARRLYQRGTWLQIQFPDGRIGWVPAGAVLADDTRVE